MTGEPVIDVVVDGVGAFVTDDVGDDVDDGVDVVVGFGVAFATNILFGITCIYMSVAIPPIRNKTSTIAITEVASAILYSIIFYGIQRRLSNLLGDSFREQNPTCS